MAMDKKMLDEFKKTLLEEKEKLEKSLGKIAHPINKKMGDYETSFKNIGNDKEDNATEVDQYTHDLSVETSLEKKLQEVLGALERIENGTYGKCLNCGEDIPIERLKANPDSKDCIKCQSVRPV
jgi:RNA polymerase-binding protein DksA